MNNKNINKLIKIPIEYKTIEDKLQFIKHLDIEFQKCDNLDMEYASRLFWTTHYYEQLK